MAVGHFNFLPIFSFWIYEHPIGSSIQALAQSLNRYYSTKAASERFKTFNRSSIKQHAISLDGISKFFDPEEFEDETEGNHIFEDENWGK